MIEIRDHADRLQRLHVLEAHEDQIDEEIDRVSTVVFDATWDDLTQAELDSLPDLEEEEAVAYAARHGFDLRDHLGRPLKDWHAFVTLIQAKQAGYIPIPDSEKPARRLILEAERFQQKREEERMERGVVEWFSWKKGFGFIKRRNGSNDVYVSAAVVNGAQIENLRCGHRVRFLAEADRTKREHATRIELDWSDEKVA